MSAKPLWTIAEVARALGLSEKFPDTPIDFVTQDSRLVKPGCLFVALSGTPSGGFVSSFASARDGWEFAVNAEQAGAVAMIVPHRIDGVRVPQLIVKDTLIDGLWTLARAARARFSGPVIGLTGSAGKTSTKEFIAAYPDAYASPSSFQQLLGRAADALQCRSGRKCLGGRDGHEPGRRDLPAERVDAADGGAGRQRAAGASGKARQPGSDPAREDQHCARAAQRRRAGAAGRRRRSGMDGRVVRFGSGSRSAGADNTSPRGESWDVTAEVVGKQIAFGLTPGAPHRLQNALAALASYPCCRISTRRRWRRNWLMSAS